MIFGKLSWENYLIAMAILVGIYYAMLGKKYFSPEIRNLLSARRFFKGIGNPDNESSPSGNQADHMNTTKDPSGIQETYLSPAEQHQDRMNVLAAELVDHINETIPFVVSQDYTNEQIITTFRSIARNYPEVSLPQFKETVTRQILGRLRRYGVADFTVLEMMKIWNKEE